MKYNIIQKDNIIIINNNSQDKYYGNLFCNNKKLLQFDVIDKKEIILAETGFYYCQIAFKNDIENSNNFLYINPSDKNKYIKELQNISTDETIIEEKINYFKIPNTNQNDFCLINYIDESLINFSQLDSFIQNNNYKRNNINTNFNSNNLIIYNNDNKQFGMINNTIFSGYMFYNNKFYFGSSDITNDIDLINIDECGAYNYLSFNNSIIKISNDFNALSRVYYFKNDDIFVSTNNYHLLLEILNCINVMNEIDEEIMILSLHNNYTQFRQPVTNKFIIKNTFCMKPFQEIIIDESGLVIKNKKTCEIFYEDYKFDKDIYKTLVKNAANDVIDNIKSVLENKKFKHFICELSGGKDSRTNYAALTNIEGAEHNVKLHTMGEDRDVNDFDTAMSIVNAYNFEYYYGSFKSTVKFDTDIQGYMKRNRSIYMFSKWLWPANKNHINDLSVMAINGECAESFYVRYYSKLLNINENNLQMNTNDLIKEYMKLICNNSILPTNNYYNLIEKHLLDVLNTSPGNIPLEQFDNLFNHYRGSTQIGGSERDYYGFASCMPIQSKHFWRAKKMTLNNFVEEKLIFDLIRELNPVLCEMDFASHKMNNAREIMKKNSIWTEEQIKNIQIPKYNYDDSKWKIKQGLKTFDVDNKFNYKTNYSNGENDTFLYNNLLHNLQKLYSIDNDKYKETAIQILYNIENNKNNSVHLRILHNKISSIVDAYNCCVKKTINICFIGVSTTVDKNGFREKLIKKLKSNFNVNEIKGYIGGFSPISLVTFAKDIFKIFENKIDIMILDTSILVPPFSIMYDNFRDNYKKVFDNLFSYINQKNILCLNIHNYVHRDINHFYSSYYNEFPKKELIGEENYDTLQQCIDTFKASENLNPTLYFFRELENKYPNIEPVYICKYIDNLLINKKFKLEELYKDNIHPNENGSEIIANRIFEYLEKYNFSAIEKFDYVSSQFNTTKLLSSCNNNKYTNNYITIDYNLITNNYSFNSNMNIYSIIILMDKNNCYFKINDIEYSSFNKEIVTLLCNKKETTKYIIELMLKTTVKGDVKIDICKNKNIDYSTIDYGNNNKLLDHYNIDLNELTKKNKKELKIIGFVGIQ